MGYFQHFHYEQYLISTYIYMFLLRTEVIKQSENVIAAL